MGKVHVLLTGAPATGKSTLAMQLAGRTGAPHLDTRQYHLAESRFTPEEARAALDRYLSALDAQLAINSVVVSEGIFIDPARRRAVWRHTASQGARLVCITLAATDEVIASRLSEREAPNRVSELVEAARRFADEFRRRPWGCVVHTSAAKLEDSVAAVMEMVPELNGEQRPLALYFDNTTWDALLGAMDQYLPPVGSRERRALSDAIDGLVWADVVRYVEFGEDAAYASTATRLSRLVENETSLASLCMPTPLAGNSLWSAANAALGEVVRCVDQWVASGRLKESVDAIRAATGPEAVAQHEQELGEHLAKLQPGSEARTAKVTLAASSWFEQALEASPSKHARLASASSSGPEATYWLAVHRLFRCVLHLFLAGSLESTYWVSSRRESILRSGSQHPVNRIRRAVMQAAAEARTDQTGSGSVEEFVRGAPAVPCFGEYMLARAGSGKLGNADFWHELWALRAEPAVMQLRGLVRESTRAGTSSIGGVDIERVVTHWWSASRGRVPEASPTNQISRLIVREWPPCTETDSQRAIEAVNAVSKRLRWATLQSDAVPTLAASLLPAGSGLSIAPLPHRAGALPSGEGRPNHLERIKAALLRRKWIAIVVLIAIVLAFLATLAGNLTRVFSGIWSKSPPP